MKRLLLLALSILFALNVYAQELPEKVPGVPPEAMPELRRIMDNFRLLTGCQPVDVVVERLTPSAAGIGLAQRSIETLAEVRLRAKRIYAEDSSHTLYINVNVVGPVYSSGVEFQKVIYDYWTELDLKATTWDLRITGTHGGNREPILQNVREHVDRFIANYLRVNADYCQ